MPPSKRSTPATAWPAGPGPQRARMTLKDVAAACKVSRTTVSNAFNRPEQLSASLREQVLSTARELGYFGPDLKARSLRRQELRECGVVFHHDLGYALSDASSLGFLRGVASELDKRQLTLQVIPKMGRRLRLDAAFQTTADVLIVHAEIGDEFAPEVQAARKPLVLVDTHVAGLPSVATDDRHGAALAMRHAMAARPDHVIVLCFLVGAAELRRLLSQRRPRRSGFVGSERVAGYAQAAREAGFPDERIEWIEIDDQYPESAVERVAALQSRYPAGSRLAIVCMSDRMALAARQATAAWHGVEVVALVGFDDIPAAAAAGLTTIRQDHFRKGALAVRVLLEGLDSTVLPVELVVRDT
jgi:DNA-binding LacI/PurR family transcriptional regulator